MQTLVNVAQALLAALEAPPLKGAGAAAGAAAAAAAAAGASPVAGGAAAVDSAAARGKENAASRPDACKAYQGAPCSSSNASGSAPAGRSGSAFNGARIATCTAGGGSGGSYGGVSTVNAFLLCVGLDNINMFQLLAWMKESKLLFKVRSGCSGIICLLRSTSAPWHCEM